MKNFFLTIASLLILGFNLVAQNASTSSSFVTNDLSTVIDKHNKSPEVWPWNGCKEFTITVQIKVVEVEFVTLICCTQGVCFPQNTQKSPFSGHKQIDITSSSKVNYGNYTIKIANGTYLIDKHGRPMNLNYVVEKNKK